MLTLLKGKMDPGRFTLGVGLDEWKEGEFGQKKEPSRWLTLAAWRSWAD